MPRAQNGFTLLEMSIVLAIIGLLAGGIMLGRGLLSASKVQSVVVDARGYSTAIQQFRDKYEALPGDMTDASRLWGRADGAAVGAACPAVQTTSGNPTCDGNGNGMINAVKAGMGETGNEDGWAWQQMMAAGFITGNYTGGASGAGTRKPGINMPRGAFTNTMYTIQSAGWCDQGISGTMNNCAVSVSGINIQWKSVSADNMVVFTATDSTNAQPQAAAISPKDAYSIDKKIDDGLPGFGQLMAQVGADSWTASTDNCAKTSSGQVVYRRDLVTNGCVLYFMNSFQNLQRQ